jgi:hypothetical protein
MESARKRAIVDVIVVVFCFVGPEIMLVEVIPINGVVWWQLLIF